MESMDELYYRIPYIKEFDASVVSCSKGKKGWEVRLDTSAFYPEGGGQLADGGTIGNVNVLDVRKVGGEVIHFTDNSVEPGPVHCVIDWQKRFDHMQAHSGEHIVSGLIHKHYGFDNVGFHMSPDKVTVDFNGVITEEQLEEIENEANSYIYANVPINVMFPSSDELTALDYRSKKELSGTVRIVEFPGADMCACCGTHVARSGEIGLIKFTSMTHYKSGVRIEMLCGRLAMQDYDKKNSQERDLCQMFSAKPYEIVAAVKKYVAESEAKDARIAAMAKALLDFKASQLPGGERLVIDFEEGFKNTELRKFCDSLVTGGKARVAVVLSPAEAQGRKCFSYVICSREVNLRDASKSLNKALSGRGGGDPTLIQGSFFAPRDEILRVLNETFA